ncbi:MAG: hypothetical protein ACI9NQ_001643 [Paracoccaceae bacterium]|jgi:hypothetical protein
MKASTFWRWAMQASSGSGSRVTALESIKVPGGTLYMKEYWFAPKVGIVKVMSRTCPRGILQSRSNIVLMNRQIS